MIPIREHVLKLIWQVAFICWKDSEIFSDFKLKSEPTSYPLALLLGLLFCKKAGSERKLTSNAKCAADKTYGGNHTWSSQRLLIQGAIYAGFPGTIFKLKRPVLYFLYLSACSSFMSTDSLGPCSGPGETSNAEKNLGEERKEEKRSFRFPRVSYPYLDWHIFTNKARFEMRCAMGTCRRHKVTGTLSSSTV